MHAETDHAVGSLLGRVGRPDDVGDDGVHAGVASRVVGDHRALAQDDDAVANREHVGQAMADEDDADALAPQRSDQLEHMLDLAHGERRGRLVHDDQPRVESQRAGDRD